MDYVDEILLEQYFPAENLSKEERNLYLHLLSKTKDIDESEIDNQGHFDIITMSLKGKNNFVRFNGAVANKNENRFVDGEILKLGNKVFVKTNVYRNYEYLNDDERMYTVFDTFISKNNMVYRRSKYDGHLNYYERELDLFTNEKNEEYVMKLK